MSAPIWLSILTSSLISALVGGLIAGAVTLRVAKNQYVNDYYKNIIQRRISAYEQLELLIYLLKTSIADNSDNKLYHFIFADGDTSKAFEIMMSISSHSMWLSKGVIDETIGLNRLLYTFPSKKEDVLSFAKENYKNIAETRTRLEKLYARDFLSLHNVPGFLKSKNPTDSYEKLPDRR
jgi:hypothetical protein